MGNEFIGQHIIYWDEVREPTRLAAASLVGWRNKKGQPTPMGKKIARTNWDNLPEDAKIVLLRHGIYQDKLCHRQAIVTRQVVEA